MSLGKESGGKVRWNLDHIIQKEEKKTEGQEGQVSRISGEF